MKTSLTCVLALVLGLASFAVADIQTCPIEIQVYPTGDASIVNTSDSAVQFCIYDIQGSGILNSNWTSIESQIDAGNQNAMIAKFGQYAVNADVLISTSSHIAECESGETSTSTSAFVLSAYDSYGLGAIFSGNTNLSGYEALFGVWDGQWYVGQAIVDGAKVESVAANIVAVPEPATMSLFAAGSCLVALRHRKK